MAEPVVVLCMKWGTRYSSDYVNVLRSAVLEFLPLEHRFVCLTDDTAGLRDDIETYPIPDQGMDGLFDRQTGAWPKLTVYKPDLYGLQGRCLFIDLDSIITSDLTPFFEAEGEIVVIREWRRAIDYLRPKWISGATGVFAFELGALGHLYDRWMKDPAKYVSELSSEQRFVSKYANDMRFWPDNWVVSFKRHVMALPLVDRIVPPREPADPAVKIIAFHGTPRPIEVIRDEGQHWAKSPRYGRGAVPFVRRYWLEHGGADPSGRTTG